MAETATDRAADSKLRRKLFDGALILIGFSLVIGAIYFAAVPNAENESGSLLKTIGAILAFLLGAGANVKGWIDLFKKDKPAGTTNTTIIGDNTKSTTGTDSPIVEGQYVKHADLVVYQSPLSVQSAIAIGIHQLPAPPADFTGRTKELKELLAKIQIGGMTISGIRGMGGIGKTALALKMADILAPEYPDAQIFLDLRGVDKQNALTPEDAMRHVIVSFGWTGKLPDESQQLASLYRSMLSEKKVLLLWDNALGEEQIRPLLVKGCLTLVTSRQHLILPGLEPLDLNTLTKKDARDLIRNITRRITGRDADAIASLCGYLPLAITLAASILSERTDLTPRAYIDRLQDTKTRLGLVEASIQLSYELLADELKMCFRQLGAFPAPFDKAAVQAVWRVDAAETDQRLGELLKFSLLNFDRKSSRYRLHDFLRAFGLSRMSQQEADNIFQAYGKYYFKVLQVADSSFYQGRERTLNGLKLFDAEWVHISFAQTWARNNMSRLVFATELCNYKHPLFCLGIRLYPHEQIQWLESSLQASRLLKDRQGEGFHLGNLGIAYNELGEMQKAIECHHQALAIAHETGDRWGESVSRLSLGIAFADLGEPRKAIEHYQQALDIAHEIGDRRQVGTVLSNLGLAYGDIGEPRKAIELFHQALAIAREFGNRQEEGLCLLNLGNASVWLGETWKAIELFHQALAIAHEIGDRQTETKCLNNLGGIYGTVGDPWKAIELFHQALAIAREFGNRQEEGRCLLNLGAAYDRLDEPRKAIEYYQRALAITHEIGDRRNEAVVSWNLGVAYQKLGEREKAITAMQILVQYESEIGDPSAEQHAQHVEELRNSIA